MPVELIPPAPPSMDRMAEGSTIAKLRGSENIEESPGSKSGAATG